MRSLSVSQIPPSHQSKGKPCLRTHYAHEPLPRDIPPSAALSALSAPPSAVGFGYPSACHPGIGRQCSILRYSRCCDPCSGHPLLLLICPRGCFRHGKSRNDNRCRETGDNQNSSRGLPFSRNPLCTYGWSERRQFHPAIQIIHCMRQG